MLSVTDELFMLMGCLAFWLLLRNLIRSKDRRTRVFMKINKTGKSAEIRYQVNDSKSKYIITQLTKTYPKSFEKVLEKVFNFSKVARKIEERHLFTLNFACKLDILFLYFFFNFFFTIVSISIQYEHILFSLSKTQEEK